MRYDEFGNIIEDAETDAKIAQTNELAESPNQMSVEELTQKHLSEEADKTVQGQLQENVDARQARLQEMAKNIEDYKARLNQPKKELTWKDNLPDYLAAAHNIINYSQGSPQKNIDLGHSSKIKKQAAAKKKSDLQGIEKLQDMYNKYAQLQAKTTPSSKEKIYQTRAGLVKIDEQGNPVEIYKDPYMASGQKVREESLDIRKEKLDIDKKMKGRLSDKEVKDITALDDGMRIIEDIENIFKNTDVTKDLGPYASRFEEASQFIPGVDRDEDFVKMQQLVGIQLADYVKSISGAQVSEQEAQRLLKNIPNMTDKPKAFKAKLDQFKDELGSAKKDYLTNIGKQKEGAKKYLDDIKSDTVLLQAPNGQTKRVKKESAQKYLDKGALIIRE